MSSTAPAALGEGGPTVELVNFLAATSLSDIPEPVVERSTTSYSTGSPAPWSGAHLPWSESAVRSIVELEGSGSASILGWDQRVPPQAAALLNGTFIQGFELDDYHEHGPLHSESIISRCLRDRRGPRFRAR